MKQTGKVLAFTQAPRPAAQRMQSEIDFLAASDAELVETIKGLRDRVEQLEATRVTVDVFTEYERRNVEVFRKYYVQYGATFFATQRAGWLRRLFGARDRVSVVTAGRIL